MEDDIQLALKQLLDQDVDVYVYFGGISRKGYRDLTDIAALKPVKKNVGVLVLTTSGGDPDAGYRIGRAMGHYYPAGVKVIVADVCKSAGTLITLAASEVVIGDRGELGPLDIQLRKPDEMFENGSGLDIIQSISALRGANWDAFNQCMVDIRVKAGLSTKLSADIATKLAAGLIAPIASQVDPLRLGEHQRAMAIAYKYGERLDKKYGNLKPNALDRLVTNYPSHGFVIDRKEAAEIFNRVSGPNGPEIALCNWVCRLIDGNSVQPYGEALVIDLSAYINNNTAHKNEEPVNDIESEIPERLAEGIGADGQTDRARDGGSGQNNENGPDRHE